MTPLRMKKKMPKLLKLPTNWLYNLSVDNNYYSVGAAISLVIFAITSTLSLAVYVRSAAYKQEDTYQ